MKIELGDKNINLTEGGIVKTEFRIASHSITEEFYPFVANTVQTQIDNIIVQPNTFKKRTFNYRNEEYLKREIGKNRTPYEIAKDFNTGESTIRGHMNKNNIERPLRNTDLLREMAEKHDTINEIAEEINVKPYEVKLALEQRDII